jgi:P27 family predicted phage terminase small subunit
MGERGPAAKPTALKLIAGNPGRRPLNLDEAVPGEMTDLAPPPEVAEDPRAAEIWGRVVPSLASCGLVRAPDWTILARYCLKFSRWVFLGQEIRRVARENPGSRGTTYPVLDEEGNVKSFEEFPYVAEWRTLDRELRLDERTIGISPAARSRITVPGANRKTEADLRRDFFRKGTA